MMHDTQRNIRFSIFDFRSPQIQNLKSKIKNPWLILIVLLGVALRLWLISFSPLNPSFSSADDGDYYHRAFQFAVTGRYIDDGWLVRPPLHVLFFAFWLRLAVLLGRPQLGVLLVQLAQTGISALTIVLGYAVARRMFDNARAGLLFAAFLAFWFPFVEQPSVFFSELLYLFLFLLHVWLLLRFDSSNRRRDLALSGIALGGAALTRSPALYSLAFVVLWLLFRPTTNDQRPTSDQDSRWSNIVRRSSFVVRRSSVVIACCLAVVGPWTLRNYMVYHRFIPIDTLGQINLWLDLDSVSQRNAHIAELRQIPQADRQAYALAHVRAILAADPLRPFRPMWPTFLHIWKAQYIEDFFIKQSFFTRPLRETAALGLLGDLLWLIYTLGGLIGLVAPAREGLHNRLFVLAWLGYSLLTVLVFHVEPRYLLPIWTLLGLYGAWSLSRAPELWADLRTHPLHGAFAAALVTAFLVLVVTYRDYPQTIAMGLARERAIVVGERAYFAGDYAAAEHSFRAALAAQPDFIDAQVDLALALAAQGRRAEALALLASGGSRRADLVGAALALRAGDSDSARSKLTRIEATAGEEAQTWALQWLRSPPTARLHLGDQHDMGYIAGFSQPEAGPNGSFRWLTSAGRVVLPLPGPLRAGATLALRASGGQPGGTPLEVRLGAGGGSSVPIAGGEWRVYRLPVPPALISQNRITVELRAPTFIPAFLDPASDDLRVLSVRISDVWVE